MRSRPIPTRIKHQKYCIMELRLASRYKDNRLGDDRNHELGDTIETNKKLKSFSLGKNL
jgi:hypothetical protein